MVKLACHVVLAALEPSPESCLSQSCHTKVTVAAQGMDSVQEDNDRKSWAIAVEMRRSGQLVEGENPIEVVGGGKQCGNEIENVETA